MIETFQLKFGRKSGGTASPIPAAPVTVFVGPNNSGKSKVLSEIHAFCRSGSRNLQDVILEEIVFSTSTQAEAIQKVEQGTLSPHHNETIRPGHMIFGTRESRHNLPRDIVIQNLQNPSSNLSSFCNWYVSWNTLMLNGQGRIGLVNHQNAGDLQVPPKTTLQVLFQERLKRLEVRRIIHDAFGTYLVVDPTHLGQLRLRLSQSVPTSEMEEQGIHAEARAFHHNALPIEQTSDGVKAFTGMICEIIAGDPSILLIDEPEAFLHPSLSFNLGKEVASAAAKSAIKKHVFVSTHSAHFVMGCIQSGAPVNIIRLTYRSAVATARILQNDEILKLMRNPLLRSTGLVSALFYEFVVVTESDADRAFYQEINERLLRFDSVRGIPNCLFLNAQNKQTVGTLLLPLRKLGIPAVGIVDVDVLKDGGKTWTSFLESGFVPPLEHQSLGEIRAKICRRLDATGKDMKKDGGVGLLNGDEREAAQNLLEKLQEYGLFVVPRGELETWLPKLDAKGHGPSWLIDVFEAMGEDPEVAGYVKPEADDVWDFMGQVKKWLVLPQRKGIPT